MGYMLLGIVGIVGLFGLMVALLEVGRRLGKRRLPPGDEASKSGLASVESAVFAVMGLLLAFSFSGALSRWDNRRHDITAEVNAIGTAYLRLDLLPASTRPGLQQKFRDYVDARLAVFSEVHDAEGTQRDIAHVAAIQADIWNRGLEACRTTDPPQAMTLVVTSLNEMFDMAQERDLTAASHPPLVVFLMLFVAILTSALIAGYDTAGSPKEVRFHMIGFAALIALTVYVTLDIEFPRVGFVRIDSADQAFVDLKASMNLKASMK